ncbi:polysaccharide pyruvyl transferase family protein [Pasteurella atlantica]|uniref:polysaccharide pyruvyl transferase family protein n=1 Tax=Pasteurella atlantica TaxID=2827233 RepID=UPI00274F530B|nr:polysaccharide pyruvyl transferase family protein [Pasteurella atlantica]MDP8098749.1 polysaccharide pyruvyl transferase family protein [Pasteurella atlantica]MDP8106861.1 polysaccharide pyruvyl transferase family protein [Pasteurella atlantica]
MKKFGLLKYQENERNIGDYVQSIAARGFLPSVDKYIGREELDVYNEENVDMIMNGWFMHQPKHWPPSDKISPLFVSFHINESVVDILTSEKSIEYLKKHEPIGCRDEYTVSVLKEKGVDAYFTGCLTLTLEKGNFYSEQHKLDVIVCDPFWSTYSNAHLFMSDLNIVQKLLRVPYYWYKRVSFRRLIGRLIPPNQKNVSFFTHFLDKNCSTEEKFEKAEELLKYYASSKLVITGRIHVALPCLAFGTPVLFVNPEKDTSRFPGIADLFTQITIKELKEMSKEDLWGKYKFENIKNSGKHLELRGKLIDICQKFING